MPRFCSSWASNVTVVRRTPSISARNSWVSNSCSLPVRSAHCNSQRHNLDEPSWMALQVAFCCASAHSVSVYRRMRSRSAALRLTACSKRGAEIAENFPGICTIVALGAHYARGGEAAFDEAASRLVVAICAVLAMQFIASLAAYGIHRFDQFNQIEQARRAAGVCRQLGDVRPRSFALHRP